MVTGRYHIRRRAVMDASVILPHYAYPSAVAWHPVYEMASTYLRVQFTAIVNPNSGQGQEALPDDGYTQAIQRLNSMNDARTIGYVATTWCTAKSGSVLDEVAVYARWGDFDPSLATAGIFFDETPTRYTPENVSYLQTICEAVHNHHGLRDGFVVHNPGALSEAQYFSDPDFAETADLITKFEDVFANWTAHGDAPTQATPSYNRERVAVTLRSTPCLSHSYTNMIVRELLQVGQSV